MKKILAGALGGAAVAVAIFGAGSAQADNEYKGMTYEKAASSINQWGKAVIASRVGDYLPTEQCLVTGSRRAGFLDSSGNNRGGEVLLYLNCNDTNTAGHPGFSAASPEGKAARQMQQKGIAASENYAQAVAAGKEAWCEVNADRCRQICAQAGTCSDELLQYLGI